MSKMENGIRLRSKANQEKVKCEFYLLEEGEE